MSGVSSLRNSMYTGVDDIMDGYDKLNPGNEYKWSVWYSADVVGFQSLLAGDESREMLKENLEVLERSQNCNLLYLKIHPADIVGFVDKKTTAISTSPIRICPLTVDNAAVAGTAGNGGGYGMYDTMRALRELPDKIDEKIKAAVKAELAEIDDDDDAGVPVESDVDKYMGIIKGITENPQVMGFLGQVLSYLKPAAPVMQHRIGMVENGGFQQPGNIQPPAAAQELQPIPFDEELMNNSLEKLRYHCDLGNDLALLAQMAETNPVFFKSMLKTLRA